MKQYFSKSNVILTTASPKELTPKEILQVEMKLNELCPIEVGDKKVYLRFHLFQ